MAISFLLIFLAVCFVAYANGANDNFKGVASLYGTGTTTLRQALWWGTLTTFAGSVCALFLAKGMLKTFGGRGLVPDNLAQAPEFLLAVALGAACTALLATKFGFPVSTTHALVGGLVGAGLAGNPAGVHLEALGKNFVQPLLLSPLLALTAGSVIYLLLRSIHLAPDHRTKTLDALHFLSGGAASFARGLNDTPKIAALLLISGSFDIRWGILAVALGMALGALVDAEKVAETMAKKVTDMNPGQGFSANLATATLVGMASWHSLPVSTTHVSVGALLGIGITTRQAKWRMIGQIILSWITTLPCAALLAALFFRLVKSPF